MIFPPAEVGPEVDVTVPLEAPARTTNCQGAVQDGEGETPVLLHTEGMYDMRGSVFSMVVTISA